MTLLDFERDGEAFESFRRSLDFLGDGTIRLLFTSGHTKGHMSILLRLTDGSPTLLVGDAAYTVRSSREQLLPMLTDDDEASARSLRELKHSLNTVQAQSSCRRTTLPPGNPSGLWRPFMMMT